MYVVRLYPHVSYVSFHFLSFAFCLLTCAPVVISHGVSLFFLRSLLVRLLYCTDVFFSVPLSSCVLCVCDLFPAVLSFVLHFSHCCLFDARTLDFGTSALLPKLPFMFSYLPAAVCLALGSLFDHTEKMWTFNFNNDQNHVHTINCATDMRCKGERLMNYKLCSLWISPP